LPRKIATLGAAVLVLAAALGLGPATAGAPASRCRAHVLHAVGTATTSYAGIAKGRVQAYRRPGGERLARFSRLNANGYPTTFLVVGAVVTRSCGAAWYRVKLPMRPNGIVGYIRPWAVTVEKVRTRIVIDLSERKLSFFRAGKLKLATTVAVGPFGPAALGVSAFSPVLTGWAQGGPIGIHGTNAPWSIGRAVSNGCIRVPNATLTKLFAATLGGTPVIIRP
jgi:L,D-transpeptidase catalytic domain